MKDENVGHSPSPYQGISQTALEEIGNFNDTVGSEPFRNIEVGQPMLRWDVEWVEDGLSISRSIVIAAHVVG